MKGLYRWIGFALYLGQILALRSLGAFWEDRVRRRARRCGFIRVHGGCQLLGLEGLEVGSNVHVGAGAFWVCDGGLEIGDNVFVSRNSLIYTRNHNYKGSKLPFDDSNVFRPVTIGRNVWIGMNVTILPGAEIGEGAIIGAGSVVYGKIEPLGIYGASSLKRISERSKDHYQRLDAEKRYGGVDGK